MTEVIRNLMMVYSLRLRIYETLVLTEGIFLRRRTFIICILTLLTRYVLNLTQIPVVNTFMLAASEQIETFWTAYLTFTTNKSIWIFNSVHNYFYPFTICNMRDYILMFGIFAFLMIFTMIYPKKNTALTPTDPQPITQTFQKGQNVVCSIDNENPPQTGTVLEDNWVNIEIRLDNPNLPSGETLFSTYANPDYCTIL